MKKFLLFILIAVFLTQAGFVFAAGQKCDDDTDCSPDGYCLCRTEVIDTGGNVTYTSGTCYMEKNEQNVVCPFSSYTSLEDILKSLINYLFWFAIILCPLMIVSGAFLMMTSAGDPKKTGLGKDLIKWAIIGLVVIVGSKFLFSTIKSVLSGP